ncbi:ribonuclease HII [Prochlorococcus sp. AH-716-E13]|nr:ribonuclease HII [Prochlorococcus sp. AH-716-E13]
MDEVGRGSVFGPVFSAIVVLTKKNGLTLKKLGINDSKKLTPKKRKDFFPEIIELSSDYSLGQSSVREIDKFGIRYATELSMIRAVKKLRYKPSELIIDGPLSLRLWEGSQRNIISGDSKFTSIAAASIIAKVTRDALMERLESEYPGYFIFKNKGYGTKQHFSSLKENGLTNLHRKSFLSKLYLI